MMIQHLCGIGRYQERADASQGRTHAQVAKRTARTAVCVDRHTSAHLTNTSRACIVHTPDVTGKKADIRNGRHSHPAPLRGGWAGAMSDGEEDDGAALPDVAPPSPQPELDKNYVMRLAEHWCVCFVAWHREQEPYLTHTHTHVLQAFFVHNQSEKPKRT